MTTWFRYVPHAKIEDMKAKGWALENPMTDNRHGAFAVLMRWQGFGEPE